MKAKDQQELKKGDRVEWFYMCLNSRRKEYIYGTVRENDGKIVAVKWDEQHRLEHYEIGGRELTEIKFIG